MRDLDKGLIVPLSHVRFLLPEDVFADHNGPDSLMDTQINDATACLVQIVLDTAIVLRRDLIECAGGVSFLLAFAQSFLMMFALLVVELVEAFNGLATDQTRDKAFFVARDCGQHIHAHIDGGEPCRINVLRLNFLLVYYSPTIQSLPLHTPKFLALLPT